MPEIYDKSLARVILVDSGVEPGPYSAYLLTAIVSDVFVAYFIVSAVHIVGSLIVRLSSLLKVL